MMKYLSNGDFSGLDSFLVEQMSLYKNVEGDAGQDMDDWRSMFEIIRSDVTKTINLPKDMQPETTLPLYSSPEILAGAIAWAPVSTKLEAFADWSSLILPPPGQGQYIALEQAELKEPNKMLAEINEISPVRFYDLAAFNMTVSGYHLRLIVVANQFGYYQPWALRDMDGMINQRIWTKQNLKQVRNTLDPWTDFDSVLNLAQWTDTDTGQERKDHPEWYDADGMYIGPDRYPLPEPEPLEPEDILPTDEPTEEPVEIPAQEAPQEDGSATTQISGESGAPQDDGSEPGQATDEPVPEAPLEENPEASQTSS